MSRLKPAVSCPGEPSETGPMLFNLVALGSPRGCQAAVPSIMGVGPAHAGSRLAGTPASSAGVLEIHARARVLLGSRPAQPGQRERDKFLCRIPSSPTFNASLECQWTNFHRISPLSFGSCLMRFRPRLGVRSAGVPQCTPCRHCGIAGVPQCRHELVPPSPAGL